MSSYKDHQNLIKEFKLLLPERIPNARFFERHVGTFLSLRFKDDMIKMITTVSNWGRYIVKINRKGMADGYLIVDMGKFQIHLELEFKTGNARISKHQLLWKNFIHNFNGKFILIRDAEQGIKEIERYLDDCLQNVVI